MSKYFTIDLEDWFHNFYGVRQMPLHQWIKQPSILEEAVLWLLDMLDEYDVPAHFFCVGWVLNHYPDLILEIHNRGHTIGSHTMYHQLVTQMTADELDRDLNEFKDLLFKLTGASLSSFRAPAFSLETSDLEKLDVLIKNGIKYDSSVFVGARFDGNGSLGIVNKPYQLVSNYGSIMEFPVVPSRVAGVSIPFCGGGYFRLLPFGVIKRLFDRGNYGMFYIHPRDFVGNFYEEGLSLRDRFRSRVGVSRSKYKLKKLAEIYEFCPFGVNDD